MANTNNFQRALTIAQRVKLRRLNAMPYTRTVAIERALILQELQRGKARATPRGTLNFLRMALGMRHHASV